jgi:hypothetical protein
MFELLFSFVRLILLFPHTDIYFSEWCRKSISKMNVNEREREWERGTMGEIKLFQKLFTFQFFSSFFLLFYEKYFVCFMWARGTESMAFYERETRVLKLSEIKSIKKCQTKAAYVDALFFCFDYTFILIWLLLSKFKFFSSPLCSFYEYYAIMRPLKVILCIHNEFSKNDFIFYVLGLFVGLLHFVFILLLLFYCLSVYDMRTVKSWMAWFFLTRASEEHFQSDFMLLDFYLMFRENSLRGKIVIIWLCTIRITVTQ